MDVDAALQSQIRNIETTYGQPLDHWFAIIDASGLTRHNEVVAMLKADHGLAHGAAHRVWLLARQRHDTGRAAPSDPADALYAGAKAGLRPLHDALLGQIRALGAFDIAPKKGYLSLRRRKQFAMIQPSTSSRIDLGLVLPASTPATGRLEPAAKFNALFTHRVRITAASDLDDELRGWLAIGTRSPGSYPARGNGRSELGRCTISPRRSCGEVSHRWASHQGSRDPVP